MPLITVTVDHTTAPVAIRERVAFAPEKMAKAVSSLVSEKKANEAVIISTCNRTELYCSTDDASKVNEIIRWLGDYHDLDFDTLKQYCYTHLNDDSVRHVMRVASGLDSLILGEPQILGQVKSAYAVSQEGACIGPALQSLSSY